MAANSDNQHSNSPFRGLGGRHGGIIITEDGSNTLFVPEIDECYHSTKGAIQESNHIFINAGLMQCEKAEINVLEIGFGTGLNALLTALPHPPKGESPLTPEGGIRRKINYCTIELYPIPIEQALTLNYPEMLGQNSRELFEKLHAAKWNEKIEITADFSLTKIKTDFTQFDFSEINEGKKFDVFYFDAFSPEKQPEMWSEDLFKKLYLCANDQAVLTTYCAKGAVRRAMQSAGFSVERLPGPPGKREILRGMKSVYSF